MIKNIIQFLKISALIAVIGFLGWGLFNMERQNLNLGNKIKGLEINAAAIEKENQIFKDSIEYFSHPENLLKELKSLFNYRQPGEKIIIIPKKTDEKP